MPGQAASGSANGKRTSRRSCGSLQPERIEDEEKFVHLVDLSGFHALERLEDLIGRDPIGGAGLVIRTPLGTRPPGDPPRAFALSSREDCLYIEQSRRRIRSVVRDGMRAWLFLCP